MFPFSGSFRDSFSDLSERPFCDESIIFQFLSIPTRLCSYHSRMLLRFKLFALFSDDKAQFHKIWNFMNGSRILQDNFSRSWIRICKISGIIAIMLRPRSPHSHKFWKSIENDSKSNFPQKFSKSVLENLEVLKWTISMLHLVMQPQLRLTRERPCRGRSARSRSGRGWKSRRRSCSAQSSGGLGSSRAQGSPGPPRCCRTCSPFSSTIINDLQKHSDTDFEGGFSLTFSQCFFLSSTNCQSFLEYCTSKPLFSKSLEFCNVKGTESAKAKELEGEKNHVNVEEIHFFNCRGGGVRWKGQKEASCCTTSYTAG